uniref:Uncharacterized protein n=1 Tax=Anguilla anguilla TaxID=7936 RepID=A0A0E9RJY4_ANGAN
MDVRKNKTLFSRYDDQSTHAVKNDHGSLVAGHCRPAYSLPVYCE